MSGGRDAWMAEVYEPFRDRKRCELFLRLAVFCHQNRQDPDGYYFEFGCHRGRTLRAAWDAFHALFDWIYVGFDSFAGLPEIESIDRHPAWEVGALATTRRELVETLAEHGMPRDRLITVEGFFDHSLTPELAERLLPRRAAVIYVDCDLYASTKPVLEFIPGFLQHGTVVVFDDWNCFFGDPERGQRRAFREFREARPELRFEELFATSEARIFVHLDRDAEDR